MTPPLPRDERSRTGSGTRREAKPHNTVSPANNDRHESAKHTAECSKHTTIYTQINATRKPSLGKSSELAVFTCDVHEERRRTR
eukprot:6504290-Prymnesium_polylepis.3